jgi:hypothetical protein
VLHPAAQGDVRAGASPGSRQRQWTGLALPCPSSRCFRHRCLARTSLDLYCVVRSTERLHLVRQQGSCAAPCAVCSGCGLQTRLADEAVGPADLPD